MNSNSESFDATRTGSVQSAEEDPEIIPLNSLAGPPPLRQVSWLAEHFWLPTVLALVLGLTCGILVMKQRHRSGQIVVSVNEATITQAAFFNRLQAQAGMPIMHRMVEEELQVQFAKRKGLLPTDGEVDARYQALTADPRFPAALAASGGSPGQLKRDLRVKMAQAAVLSEGVTVTDAEARKYYAEQTDPRNTQAQFYHPAAVIATAIETSTQAESTKVVQELNKGIPFEIAAKSLSEDRSQVAGGRLDPLLLGRNPFSKTPDREKALFSLKVGERLGPILVAGRWWMFRCDDKTPATTVPYEKVAQDCRQAVALKKGAVLNGRKVEADFQAFQRSSSLKAFWRQYQPALRLQ